MDRVLGIKHTTLDNAVLLAGRLLLAWIFVHEGASLAANFDAASAGMAKMGVPAAALIPTIALQLIAGLAIAVGWNARSAAAVLGLFCLATAFLFHNKFRQPKRAAAFRERPRHRWRNVCIDVARRWGSLRRRIRQTKRTA
jgi:uncharacterized membrane protein YphA (DoxX/SURF4 family)